MKVRSLNRRLYAVSLATVCYMFLTFGVYFTMARRETRQFEELMERNDRIAGILTDQIRGRELFAMCVRSPEEALIRDYQGLNERILEALRGLRADSAARPETLTYLRVIENMLLYEMAGSQRLFSPEGLGEADYEEIGFLKLLADRMNEQIQELLIWESRRNTARFWESSQSSRRIQRLGFGFLLLLVILLSGGMLLGVGHVLKRVRVLIGSAHSLYRGEPGEEEAVPLSEFAELNELAMAFNKMNRDIRGFIRREKEKSRLELELQRQLLENEKKDRMLQKAQLNFLQSQVNPHFLFNALNVIGKQTVLNNPEESLELIESISKILRFSLDHREETVRLGEETAVLEAYFTIQKARYGERLAWRIEVEAEARECPIPAMVLQPLAENSIKYGLDSDLPVLRVRAGARFEGEHLVLTVTDNGPGMAPGSEREGGIGLPNLRERLRLHYGEGEWMRIESSPGEGATVRIRLPRERCAG